MIDALTGSYLSWTYVTGVSRVCTLLAGSDLPNFIQKQVRKIKCSIPHEQEFGKSKLFIKYVINSIVHSVCAQLAHLDTTH